MAEQGLRAWIGEVERKLRARTRVMLALAVIAIGGAGAAAYLAVDAHDTAVSEGDVQALQQRLEARINQVGGGAAVTRLEAEVRALKAEVEALKGGTAKKGSAREGAVTPEGPVTNGSGTEGPATKGPGAAGSVTEVPGTKAPTTEGSAKKKTGANGTAPK